MFAITYLDSKFGVWHMFDRETIPGVRSTREYAMLRYSDNSLKAVSLTVLFVVICVDIVDCVV